MKTILFAITFKETGEILTPDSFKEYWPKYGSGSGSGLYGWKPPKKIYYNFSQAKRGFSFIPEALKPQLEISVFERVRAIADGGELAQKQAEAKEKRKIDQQKRVLQYEKKRAERQLREAQEKLDRLK